MASRPWTKRELTLLEEHAEDNDWMVVALQIHGRSVNAVKVKMSKLRSKLGLADARYCDGMDHFNQNAIVASEQLREATLQIGKWS
jgi:hypothetical protein